MLAALQRQSSDDAGSGLPRHWELDLSAPSARVPMPDPELRQVLTNLFGNAAVHGSPPIGVAVRSAGGAAPDVVVLSVSDAGAGLPADFLPRAVERFGRADQARARPGAGLGLALVLALVDASGGELRLCSAGAHHRYRQRFDVACVHPVTGTTVSVLLPEVTPTN